jgi:hypothetical protein
VVVLNIAIGVAFWLMIRAYTGLRPDAAERDVSLTVSAGEG